MYTVTKHFISGFLSGLTITEKTNVKFEIGKTYTPCAGNSSYVVVDVK